MEWIYAFSIFSIGVGILLYVVGIDTTNDEPEFSKVLIQIGFIICVLANTLMIIFK